MNPTHDKDELARRYGTAAAALADLLTHPGRFGAWIAKAVTTVKPDPVAGEDGFTLTDAGRQVLADTHPGLRASGEPVTFDAVRGWCEQCGQALPAVCTWDEPLCGDCVTVVPIPEPGTVDAPQVLRSAALYLERHGWIQGCYYDPTATVFTPAADLVGAIGMVCYGGPVEAPAQHFDDPGFLDFEQAVLHLDRYLLVEDGSEAYEFNDAKGRRVEDVIRVLRDAAARPAEELIDALRALSAWDRQLTDRVKLLTPQGIWAAEQCPCCGSGGRHWRQVVNDGDGPAYCDHDWHDGDSDGGDAR